MLVHALNPYGMAWLRRFNEENVDLNRNFLGPDEAYSGAPEKYPVLDPWLNPPSPPSSDFFYLKGLWLWASDRGGKLKQAVAGGQYEYPNGLFFGGKRFQQGPSMIQTWVGQHLGSAEHIVVIDIHTGLGKYGEDTLLVEQQNVDRLQRIYGRRVASLNPEGTAYRIRGGYHMMFPRKLPKAKVDFVSEEFGTYHSVRVLHALREENRWYQHGSGAVDHPTKLSLKEAFCPNDAAWQMQVLARGKDVLQNGHTVCFSRRN